MNEQTEKLIRELAEKLGTTANHLWEVLNRQLYVEVACVGALFVFLSVVAFFMTKYAIEKFKEKPVFDTKGNPVLDYNDVQRKKAEWDGDNGWAVIFCVVDIFFLAGAMFYAFNFVKLSIQAFFNPEYWALQQLMNIL